MQSRRAYGDTLREYVSVLSGRDAPQFRLPGAVMREPEICKGVLERLLHTRIDHIEYPASLAGSL